jgi:hypothetical protein
MKVLSEKELIKLHVKGTAARDSAGKVVVPGFSSVPKVPKAPHESEPVDPMPAMVEGISACIRELETARKSSDLLLEAIHNALQRMLPDQGKPVESPPKPCSWKFIVHRDGDGFIREIVANPTHPIKTGVST